MKTIEEITEKILKNEKLAEEEKELLLSFLAFQAEFSEAGYCFSLSYSDEKVAKAGEKPDITIKNMKTGKRYDLVKILEFLSLIFNEHHKETNKTLLN